MLWEQDGKEKTKPKIKFMKNIKICICIFVILDIFVKT